MTDAVIGDGLKVEKGCYIQVNTFSLHHDKDLWGEDAEEFRPER